jgi:pyruvate ferredoxin oxidoreductase alpha subunit
MGYRLSEDARVMLPVMVNMDGYILTHGVESVDMPEQQLVDKFLPPYKAPYKLDPDNPTTLGFLADPDYYLEARFAIQKTQEDVLNIIPEISAEFKKIFGRDSGGLIQGYKLEDAQQVIIAMGSVIGTIKDTVDDLRKEGKKVGALKITTYRPFPKQAIYDAIKNIPEIAVLDKSISLGAYGPLYTDLLSVFQGKNNCPKISGFVIGLGGRDITKASISEVFNRLSGKQVDCDFLGVKENLLEK